MRWRAQIRNLDLFMKVVNTLAKLGPDCIVHLGPEEVRFINEFELAQGSQAYCTLKKEALFDEYLIESAAANNIGFSLKLENLEKALKSAIAFGSRAEARLIKKKGQALLSITLSNAAKGSQLDQDIPIELVSQVASRQPPEAPEPLVHIVLPPLKQLRTVIERMKQLADHLTIKANMDGMLIVEIDTDFVHVSTTYCNLPHFQLADRPLVRDPTIQAEVKVDIKKFSRFLASTQIAPTNTICCLTPGHSLFIHVSVADLVLNYYLSVISL